MNKNHYVKEYVYGGRGCEVPHILNIGARWIRSHLSPVIAPISFYRRLGGTQSPFEPGGEEKNANVSTWYRTTTI
jgi:hypothetical protein